MPTRQSVATAAARGFLEFVNQTGSPYHSVSACKALLLKANFQELKEDAVPWGLKRGGKYFVTKHGSSLCAFVVGEKFKADGSDSSSGLVICGAHTDSPCLRLRPNTKLPGADKHVQVGIQTYGGGLWHTWFDRPLGLAGTVVVQDPNTSNLVQCLVKIDDPILTIPNLAIHLTTADERKAFAVNAETHLQPILCMGREKEEEPVCPEAKAAEPKKGEKIYNQSHDPQLLQLIADTINEDKNNSWVNSKMTSTDIVDVDLCLFDTEPSRFVGLNEDFIYSGRIDNLVSVYAQLLGLLNFSSNTDKISSSSDISLICAFDHEEVGSQSTVGADSAALEQWIRKIYEELNSNSGAENAGFSQSYYQRLIGKSMFFSLDGAHGLHPNYAAKHQPQHQPLLGKGLVIKTNANQRYATTPVTSSLFKAVCKKSDVPVQEFVVRNDSGCGSTIGPSVSSNLGIRSIDIGISQWAMHSCKETCSSKDIGILASFCEGAFAEFRGVDKMHGRL